MSTNDGGPAFPAPVEPKTNWSLRDVTSGMSLHAWYVGQALAGPNIDFIAGNFNDADLDRHFGKSATNITRAMKLVAAAHDLADAAVARASS